MSHIPRLMGSNMTVAVFKDKSREAEDLIKLINISKMRKTGKEYIA